MTNASSGFDAAMLRIYQRAKSEAGYTASIFFQMLDERGGLATAKYLINTRKPSIGYTRLHELHRLDLTVEALVVENAEWHRLFEPEELKRAESRLREYEYKFKGAVRE